MTSQVSVADQKIDQQSFRSAELAVAACETRLRPNQSSVNIIFENRLAEMRKDSREMQEHMQRFSASVLLKENIRPHFNKGIQAGMALEPPLPKDETGHASFLSAFQSNILRYEQEVIEFERRLIRSVMSALQVSDAVACTIIQACQNTLESLVLREKDGIVKQNHNVTHLKVYTLPGTDQLVADYGMNVLATGSSKMVKVVQRLGGLPYVRLTDLSKDPGRLFLTPEGRVELKKEFSEAIKKELQARTQIEGVPYIAGITEAHYRNTRGQLKTRYFMTKYETDLWPLTMGNPVNRDPKRALACCRTVFRCVSELHRREYVHGDLKLSNVLILGSEGYVCDLCLLSKEGISIGYDGTPTYMAPETFLLLTRPLYNRSMDMFALGMILLAIVKPDLYCSWCNMMGEIEGDFTKRRDDIDKQKKQYRAQLSSYLASEAVAKLATAICEVPAKGRAHISTKPIVVTMGEERSELYPRRHEQSAVVSFAKASSIQLSGQPSAALPVELTREKERLVQEQVSLIGWYKSVYDPNYCNLQQILCKDNPSHLKELIQLISELIAYDPTARPTIQIAGPRFEAFLATVL